MRRPDPWAAFLRGVKFLTGRSSSASQTDAPRAAVIFFTVLVPFGLGYYLSYLYRTMNAVIAPQLVAEVGLSAADLGFLTSVYFITFAAVQLPLGVALDRYGPRRVQTVLLLVAAVGGFLFSIGTGFVTLSLARACIGLGVAGCFMAALKANALWWPRERLPLFNSITAAFGSFGALSATAPVEAALAFVEWRDIFVLIAVTTACIAAATWFVVPERSDRTAGGSGIADEISEMATIYRDGFFWRMGVMLVVCMSVYISYQTLWAGPWLRDVAGLERAGVANHLLLIQLGMFAGVLLIGVITDRLRRIAVTPMMVLRVGLFVYLGVQLLLVLEVTRAAAVLWPAFGFFGATMFLCYAIFSQHYPTRLTGRVTTANNMILFFLIFVVQWGIGAIIDLWPVAGGRYDPTGHQAAFAVMLVLETAACLWFVWPRRTQTVSP